MELVIEITKFEAEFTKQFGKGTVIETTVTDIVSTVSTPKKQTV